MKKYLVFNNVFVGGYHALAGLCVAGLPAMSAATGFSRAFALKLAAFSNGETVKADGIALAVLAQQMFEGHEKFVRYSTADREGFEKSFEAPTVARLRANLVGSLVLRMDVDGDGSWLTEDVALTVLETMRFAGGEVQPGPLGEDVRVFLKETRDEALRLLPSTAFLIRDGSPLIQELMDEGQSPEDALRFLISRKKSIVAEKPESTAESDEPAEEPVYLGNYVPVAAGFRLLEQPTQRSGTRFGLPHAFAETLITAARTQLVASVRSEIRLHGESPEIFWKDLFVAETNDIRATAAY